MGTNDRESNSGNNSEEMNNLAFSYSSGDENVLGCSQCRETLQRLYEDNKALIQNIEYAQKTSNQVKHLYDVSAMGLAVRRIPALFVTLVLEMLGGLIIHQLHDVIQSLTLIVSFMPAISALSGNLGLQASSNTIRGLGTGIITPKNYGKNIFKEIKSGLLTASIVAVVMSSIGTVWAHLDKANVIAFQDERSSSRSEEPIPDFQNQNIQNSSRSLEDMQLQTLANITISPDQAENTNQVVLLTGSSHAFLFGGVIFIGTWISMMVSTVNGASTPIVANILHLDPAKIAGPLETAFQDIVGQSFLLGLSYVAFHYIEHII